MVKGRVIGMLWSTRRVASLPPGALLAVKLDGGAEIVAFDPLGCATGEEVLVTQGSVAAAHFEGVRAPVDALIVGSVDERG